MKMCSYKKKEKKVNVAALSTDDLIAKIMKHDKSSPKHILTGVVLFCIVTPVLSLSVMRGINENRQIDDAMFTIVPAPIAAAASKKDLISIPTGIVKANPFLPYRDVGGGTSVSDVPKFDLVEPPEAVNENSDAARVMDTIVSGILYDKFSPSAILNIEGNDYLVKKGDTVNNYKVLNIMQDSVTVKLGANVYKAGIGEILTEGTINHNEVSNLNNKFGGEKR